MRFGLIGGTYTSRSGSVADEEAINWYVETLESQGGQVAQKAYGGASAEGLRSLYPTPGLSVFATLPGIPRGECWTGSRMFAVGGSQLTELDSNGASTPRGAVTDDGKPVSLAFSAIQIFIVSGGRGYCLTLATNTLVDVTALLGGVPEQVWYSDGYFIVSLVGNKFQISTILDGNTWPGLQVNEVSVFAEPIVSIVVNHRELWVYGSQHAQPYTDTGSDNIFDVIPGSLIEKGCAATFSPCLLDNSVFWLDQDARGARVAWRAEGYNPQRVSTHAVEAAWSQYTAANFANAVTYAYQDGGHLFWVIYIPGADCSWVYDVAESLWHKRAFWAGSVYEPHHSWNHVYAFGKHLVGDWKSNNIYEMSTTFLTDAGTDIRRVRRAPTVSNEMEFIYHGDLTADFETGLGPQAMLRWSDDRGRTWSNEHVADCGLAGEFKTRVIWRRLGRSRYRVYELSVSDPIQWTVIGAYLRTSDGE